MTSAARTTRSTHPSPGRVGNTPVVQRAALMAETMTVSEEWLAAAILIVAGGIAMLGWGVYLIA
jgi:hypothetical protein